MGSIPAPAVIDFELKRIREVYEGFDFENEESIWFLDAGGDRVRVENIEKVDYDGKIYGVDVENDIVLVRRVNGVGGVGGEGEGFGGDVVGNGGFEGGKEGREWDEKGSAIWSGNSESSFDCGEFGNESCGNNQSLSVEVSECLGIEFDWIVDPVSVNVSEFVSSGNINVNVTLENNFSHLEISDVAPYDSLVGYWPFDVDVDSKWVSGVIGNAYEFDGDGDYVETSVEVNTSKSFSMSSWVYPIDDIDVHGILTDGGSPAPFYLDDGSGTVRCALRLNNGTNSYIYSSYFNINEWHLCSVTFDESTNNASIYLDGVFQDYMIKPNGGTKSDLYIGNNLDANTFNGSIDEVMIFNRSLTGAEIASLYDAQANGSRLMEDDSGLVSAWRMDEVDGKNVSDVKELNYGVLTTTGTANHYDYSVLDNDGVATDALWSSAGVYGGAMEFDGENGGDYVIVDSNGDSFGKTVCINGCTFSVWGKKADLVNDGALMGRSDGDDSNWFVRLEIDDAEDTLFVIYENGSDTGCIIDYTGGDVNQDVWYYYVGVYDNSTGTGNVSLYRDGVYLTSTTCGFSGINATAWADDEDFMIGSRDDNSIRVEWNGSIDEVMIFNTSLTGAQISDIYNNQSGRFKVNGTQTLKQFNMSLDDDWIKVTENDESLMGSDLLKRIGEWNVSQGYKDWDLGEHWGEFGGTNYYVMVDDNGDSFGKTVCINGCTFSAWAKKADLTNTGAMISRGDGHVDDWFFNLYVDLNEDSRFSISENGNLTVCEVDYIGGDISQDVWYHYVGVYDNSTGTGNVSVYRDGVILDSTTCDFSGINMTAWADDEDVMIGAYDEVHILSEWNGSIDEVMTYNRSLNASEISELYGLGRDIEYESSLLSDDNLVSWWGFDRLESDGNISDKVGSNDGDVEGDVFINGTSGVGNGLVGYWHFDNLSSFGENATHVYDFSGSGNNGTAFGGSDSDSGFGVNDGVFDGGWMFDGSGDTIEIADNDSLDVINGFTIGIWIKRNLDDAVEPFIAKLGDSLANQYSMRFDSSGTGEIKFAVYDDTEGGAIGKDIYDFNSGAWHFLVGTYEGGNSSDNLTLYVDGIEQTPVDTSESSMISMRNTSGVLRMGGDGYAPRFNGSLDEVMIFNRSLSASEVEELYVKGRAKFEYSDYQDADVEYFNVNMSSSNFILNYKFNAGNSSNPFYSPVLRTSVAEPVGFDVNVTDVGSCRELNDAGTVYVLDRNVSSTGTCFNVTAENVTIDCAGYEINYSYSGVVGYGVYSDQNFTIVQNCVINKGVSGGGTGIWFDVVSNGSILNNNISVYQSAAGILVGNGGDYNYIFNNNVSASGGTSAGNGATIDSNYNIIYKNDFRTTGNQNYGLSFGSGNYNNISNNVLTSTSDSDAALRFGQVSSYNNISNNILLGAVGIYFYYSNHNNTFINNTINVSGRGVNQYKGICRDNVFKDSYFETGSYAFNLNYNFEAEVIDSEIVALSSADINVGAGSPLSLRFLNVTFNKSDVIIANESFRLTVEYYLDAETTDATTGAPLGNTNVTGFYSNGSEVFSYLTGGNASGLVGYWKFNNDSRYGENATHVFDFSMNGNNGSVVGGSDADSGFTASGYYEGGQMFDGDGDYVDLGSDASLDDINFTLSFWVYPVTEANNNVWVGKDTTVAGWKFFIQDITSNKLRFQRDWSSGDVLVDFDNAYTLNTWNHIVLTADNGYGNTTNLTVNGVAISPDIGNNGGTYNSDAANSLYLGFDDGGTGLNGSIDEVMIYNRSLNASEISELYTKGLARIERQNVTEYTQSWTGEENKTYVSPMIVTSEKSGYRNYRNISVNQSDNLDMLIGMNTTLPGIVYEGPSTGADSVSVGVNVNVSVSNVSSDYEKFAFVDLHGSLVGWWRMDDLNGSGDVVDYTRRNNGSVE
ncbi:hypothetical protein HOE91_05770, partial [archaeon]|nr:hypothetical protein [archaeon]